MRTEPTLVVLAAGMGSRYGGLKQLEAVGPAGETLMDYSLFDAVRAGFRQVVFVIRKDFSDAFQARVGKVLGKKVPHRCVFQEMDALPSGFCVPSGRTKPWGTGHAVLVSRDAVDGPFAVINADDFYGRKSFDILFSFLSGVKATENKCCMVGFPLGKTLSEHGPVSRAVCETTGDGFLCRICERTGIERKGDVIVASNNSGSALDPAVPVSMNMWGFTPAVFADLERQFRDFLVARGKNEKTEFYIPSAVERMITEGGTAVRVFSTTEQWFGITYPGDRSVVAGNINMLVKNSEYPSDARF